MHRHLNVAKESQYMRAPAHKALEPAGAKEAGPDGADAWTANINVCK